MSQLNIPFASNILDQQNSTEVRIFQEVNYKGVYAVLVEVKGNIDDMLRMVRFDNGNSMLVKYSEFKQHAKTTKEGTGDRYFI